MKKSLVIIGNVIIIAAILIFVVLYSSFEQTLSYRRQVEHFENTLVTMESVTENYLEGEQQICDVWAHFINSQNMTMEGLIVISNYLPAERSCDHYGHVVFLFFGVFSMITGSFRVGRLNSPRKLKKI